MTSGAYTTLSAALVTGVDLVIANVTSTLPTVFGIFAFAIIGGLVFRKLRGAAHF